MEHLELSHGALTFDAVADGPDDGAPVLLLHGFPETSHSWRFVQPQLTAAGLRSVAPDLRGYSPRARPTEASDFSIELLVGDVIAMADELGWDAFHLVGHDWGGALAWQTAGRHQHRVRSLAVVSTPHPSAFADAKQAGPGPDGQDQAVMSSYMDLFRQPGAEDMFLGEGGAGFQLLLEGSGLDAASAAHYATHFASTEALSGALNWYRGADPFDASGLGPITMPTLYVWSTDDVAVGRLAAERTARYVEGPYRFEVLDGTSHWIPEAEPAALSGFLLGHIASTAET
ncbi:alpha/beta fold hydrolase [Aquihabitans sp. McL0605]|uniref:alpha/beta fold hydrolase n=1 Tax=Aquihabitans sp. McL0605 TaxID=3415671 RepID=UPI003CEAB9E6